MASLNKVMIIGNLTRDVELRYTPKGTAVAELGLAINRTWKDDNGQKKEEVTFVDISMFGKLAEIAGEYLKKGSSVYIAGRLKLESWDDKQTGQKRSKLKVVGEEIQFLGGRDDSTRDEQQGQQRQQSRQQTARRFTPNGDHSPDPDLDTDANRSRSKICAES